MKVGWTSWRDIHGFQGRQPLNIISLFSLQ
jgi:hypothetical protein